MFMITSQHSVIRDPFYGRVLLCFIAFRTERERLLATLFSSEISRRFAWKYTPIFQSEYMNVLIQFYGSEVINNNELKSYADDLRRDVSEYQLLIPRVHLYTRRSIPSSLAIKGMQIEGICFLVSAKKLSTVTS